MTARAGASLEFQLRVSFRTGRKTNTGTLRPSGVANAAKRVVETESFRRTSKKKVGIRIGPLHFRRSTLMQATPADVWAQFASFARIKQWFGFGHVLHTLEPVAGGSVDISIENDTAEDNIDDRIQFIGSAVVADAESELTFSTGKMPATLWTFRVTPAFEGTIVEFFQHGCERAGRDAADRLEQTERGWDMRLGHKASVPASSYC